MAAKLTYSRYKKDIRSLLAEYGRQGMLVGSISVKFLKAKGILKKEGGIIRARDPDLVFKDGASLKVYEEVKVENGKILRLKYSYHYERPGGYFFRYEREPSDDPLRKPEFHMHAVLDLPHFPAPAVSLETILALIAANFYSQQTYSRQIIGTTLQITV